MHSKKPLFYPAKVCGLKFTSISIEDLKIFPFFDNLKDELPMYLSKTVGVSTEVLKLQWW